MKIFCLSIFNENYDFFKNLKLEPVGLGNKNYNNKWLNDLGEKNITEKNLNFGEYTFHYSLWKNIKKYDFGSGWIGFCTYRRFWIYKNSKEPKNKNDLNKIIIKEEPPEWKDYESILAEPIYIKKMKTIKIIKNGFFEVLKDPKLIIKEKLNVREHFNIFHGSYFLNKAIDILESEHKVDFISSIEKNCFNPHNLFICKNKEILFRYYNDVFKWLFECEVIFSKEKLNTYGKIRIYGFLAERFASYWFNKYTKTYEQPYIFFDTNKII